MSAVRKVDYRSDLEELGLGAPVSGTLSILCWVKCLGWAKTPTIFNHPRTGRQITLPADDTHFAVTVEHYGPNPWYFGSNNVQGSLAGWKVDIFKLADERYGKEAIILLRESASIWRLPEPMILVMGTKQVELFPDKHVLIQSLDPLGGWSFVPEHCVQEIVEAAELFDGPLFSTKFDRTHPLVAAMIPEQLK